MKYFLPIDDQKTLGQLIIADEKNHPLFIALGKFSQSSGTIFLNDLNKNEVGRISVSKNQLGIFYTILLPGHDGIKVHRLRFRNYVYYRIPLISYSVFGQQKKSNFRFYFRTKKIAQADLQVLPDGPNLVLQTNDNANQVILILLSLIFLQPDFWTLRLNLKTKRYTFEPNF